MLLSNRVGGDGKLFPSPGEDVDVRLRTSAARQVLSLARSTAKKAQARKNMRTFTEDMIHWV